MKEIKYIVADVTEPIGDKNTLICHCCNDIPAMGAGVAKAIYLKWPIVRERYMKWGKTPSFKLGEIQPLMVAKKVAVINMIGQHGIHSENGIPPIRYDALKSCFIKTEILATKHDAIVNIPYLIGCDLAGGSWEIVEQIIKETLLDKGVEVTAYDLFNKRLS